MEQNNFLNKLFTKSSNFQMPHDATKMTPSFKPSLFSKTSLPPVSNTSPSSFYAGKVQYGGAMSAMRNNLVSPYVIPKVKKVPSKLKAVDQSGNDSKIGGSLSSTARMILKTLEKMSTPLRDIKKIPQPNFKVSHIFGGQHRKRPLGSRSLESSKKFCPPSAGRTSLTQSCVVPSAAKLPLDNSLATKSLMKNISVNSESKTSTSSSLLHRGKPAVLASLSSSTGLKRSVSNTVPGGGGGKIRNQRKNHTHYSSTTAHREDEVQPNLPDITFTVAQLPSFNFIQPASTSTPAPSKPLKKNEAKSTSELEYTFALPTPAVKKRKKITTTNAKACHVHQTKEVCKTEEIPTKASSSTNLKVTGSVMDILGNNKNIDKKKDGSTVKPTLGELFKKPNDKWECEVCMVLNDTNKTACISCTSPKPGYKPNILSVDGTKWECNICLIKNEDQLENCEACSAPKPNANSKCSDDKLLSDWTCDVCLVVNKPQQTSCVACEEPKPGENISTPLSVSKNEFSSNIQNFSSNIKNSGPTFSFGVAKTESKSVLPSVSTKSEFGITKPEFGITKSVATSSTVFSSTVTKSESDASGNVKPIDQSKKENFESNFKSNLEQVQSLEKKWICNVCLVPNDFDRPRCIACESPRSDESGDNQTNNANASSFKFGNTSSKLFQFGIAEPKVKSPSVSTSELRAITTSSLPKVGSKTSVSCSDNLDKATTTVQSNAFQFGITTSSTSSASSTGNLVLPNTESVSSATFNFSSKPISSATAEKPQVNLNKPAQVVAFQFGSLPEQSNPDSSEEISKPHEQNTTIAFVDKKLSAAVSVANTDVVSKPVFSLATASTSSFGIKPIVTSISTNSTRPLSKVKDNTTSPPKLQPSVPFGGFGQSAGSFNQGLSVTTTSTLTSEQTSTLPKPMFSFGANEPSASASDNTAKAVSTTPFVFGTGSSSNIGKEPQGFDISTNSKPVANAAKLPVFPGFGKQEATTSENKFKQSTFSGFGTESTKTENVKSTPATVKPFMGFGQGLGNPAKTQANFAFGSGSAQSSNSASSKDATSLSKPAFSFGNSSATSQSQFGANTFGIATAPATAPVDSGFKFGAFSASASQSQNNMFGTVTSQTDQKPVFSFGTSGNETSKPQANFQFNKPQTASSGNGNSAFNFGQSGNISKNPTPSAGFNFGSSNSAANQPFQFGSNQGQMQPRTNTFQFGASQPTPFGQTKLPNASSNAFNIGQSNRNTPSRTMKQAKRRLKK